MCWLRWMDLCLVDWSQNITDYQHLYFKHFPFRALAARTMSDVIEAATDDSPYYRHTVCTVLGWHKIIIIIIFNTPITLSLQVSRFHVESCVHFELNVKFHWTILNGTKKKSLTEMWKSLMTTIFFLETRCDWISEKI